MNKRNLAKQKGIGGITLIALVITIIVLLILAGVSIATLTGENGILTQADTAKARTEEAQVEEEIKLAYNVVQTDSYVNGWDINKKAEEMQKELQREDSNAEVTVKGTNLEVSYKDYETTISADGTVAELAKAKAYNTSLSSTIPTGAAWDRVLVWLYETGEKTIDEITLNSASWGNYSDDTFSNTDSLIKTGQFEETEANNIYDLAGNIDEWITESYNTSLRVFRGGYYGDGGYGNPSSGRFFNGSSSSTINHGFRLALFM